MAKYAIVTGSARGIGRWSAVELAEEGYNVVLNYVSDRGAANIDAALEEVKSKGVEAIAVRADVSTYEGCKAVFDAGREAFGDELAVLISNAGICDVPGLEPEGENIYAPGGVAFSVMPVERMKIMIETNLMSQLYCAKLALPLMTKNHNGCIINISSNSGIMGVPGYTDYSASKGGTIAFTKALAKEVAEYDIKVNAIAPGCYMTDMVKDPGPENMERLRQLTPLKRLGEEKDMKALVKYLVATNFLTGQVISPNGGWTI